MTVNLNDMATVTLTPTGVAALMAYWAKGNSDRPIDQTLDIVCRGWRQGKVKMELRRVMAIFGPVTHMGSLNAIETNIDIETRGEA